MYPHRIRLRGPWEATPPAPKRVPMPGRLVTWGVTNFAGPIRLRRRFGYPGRIDEGEHIWLTFDEIVGQAELLLNDTFLGSVAGGAFECEVTTRLKPRNVLDVALVAESEAAGLPGEVALEIRRDAFLRSVSARLDAEGMVHLSGQVVGATSEPLELYTLWGRVNVDYRRMTAAAQGEPFHFSFKPETAETELRVQLVNVSTIWYGTLVTVTPAPGEPPSRRS